MATSRPRDGGGERRGMDTIGVATLVGSLLALLGLTAGIYKVSQIAYTNLGEAREGRTLILLAALALGALGAMAFRRGRPYSARSSPVRVSCVSFSLMHFKTLSSP
jgi:hypothetical protein